MALGAAGVVLSVAAAWLTATGAGAEPRWFSAVVHSLVIAAPIAAGLYAVIRQPGARFGWLLVLAGVLWSPTMLAESSDSVLYSMGRVSAWFAELLLVYLVLAFPSGRLVSRADRLLFRSALGVLLVLFLPLAVFGDFPKPNPWASCGTECPDNAFNLTSSEPGFVSSVLAPLAPAAALLIFAAVALRVLHKLVRGSSLLRAELVPVLAAAGLRMAAAVGFLAARAANPDAEVTDVLGVVALLGIPAMSLGFVVGLMRSRARAGRALSKLSGALGRPTAQQLQHVIAEAVDDPSLEVVYRTSGDPAEWVDDVGYPVTLPDASENRATTEIHSGGAPLAALIHDPALAEAPAMIEVARGFARMSLQNQRLETELRSSLRELKESRSRIMSAADSERRRIERDLHDGAQQRLLALAIELELAGDLVTQDAERGAKRLHELVGDVNEAMADIRSLAGGLYPSILVERGLVDALSEIAVACPLPATLRSEDLGRYAPEIEGAVYFCCREALQNSAKHAGHATSVSIALWETDALHFEVRDDGAGLPAGHADEGAGLTNMRDRIGAVGGTLAIESHPGGGTCVMGAVPVGSFESTPPIDALLLRATDALPDCFAIYRAVTDASGSVVDFAVEHMNDAARHDMGVGAQAPIGQTLGQLQPDYLRSRSFRWLRHIVELEVPGSREDNAYEPSAGEGRRLVKSSELRAVPLGDGRVAVVSRDVTEHARADAELRLRSMVLSRAAEGVCLVRASDNVILYANHHFSALLGYEDGELGGRPAADIGWITADLERSGEVRYELRNRRKDGSLIWCEAHVVGFDHPEHGRVWISVQQDVTAKREARDRATRGPGHVHGLAARWGR